MIVVLTGPPCAGKTTHARTHAQPGDLIADLDTIAHAIGYPHPHIIWGDRHPAARLAQRLRNGVIDTILATGNGWIIDTNPSPAALANYKRAGATITTLDPGQYTCEQRAHADNRPAATLQQIARWYD